MKKFFSIFIVSTLILLSASCGKKGPIQPPLAKTPQYIETFGAVQRGKKIMLEWENPTTYVDGSPMGRIEDVEIWLIVKRRKTMTQGDPVSRVEFSEEEFLDQAELFASLMKEELAKHRLGEDPESLWFRYYYPLTKRRFTSFTYTFGVRVKDRKKRKSGFSRFLAVEPRNLPLPPKKIRVAVHPRRIRINWEPPMRNIDRSSPPNVKGYFIYRARGEEDPIRLNSRPTRARDQVFLDSDFQFGETYRYSVRATATLKSPYLLSDESEIVEIVPEDTFSPDPPSGLVSITGVDFISLSWDENQAEDLVGYRVWRKEEGAEEYLLLTLEPIRENTFTDARVEKNKTYLYSITALDKKGNESEKSKALSEIIKDEDR